LKAKFLVHRSRRSSAARKSYVKDRRSGKIKGERKRLRQIDKAIKSIKTNRERKEIKRDTIDRSNREIQSIWEG